MTLDRSRAPVEQQRIPELDPHVRRCMDIFVRVARAGEDFTRAMLAELGEPLVVKNYPFVVLTALSETDELRPTDVMRLTGLTSGGVSGVLARLEERGLIARDFGLVPGDRRAIVIRLTAKGRDAVAASAQALERVTIDLLRDLDRMTGDAPAAAGDVDTDESEPLDVHAVWLRLGRLGHDLSWQMLDAGLTADRGYGGNLPMLIMYPLYVHENLRPSELMRVTGLTSSGVSTVLERLELHGLIERQLGRVPGDRRAIVVRLTDQGRRDMLRVAEIAPRLVDEAMDDLRPSIAVAALKASAPAGSPLI